MKTMIIPGGGGHVGQLVQRHFRAAGWKVVVLSRSAKSGEVEWDGKTIGPWAKQIDGADAVLNLAGRSVSCRYTEANLKEMMDSRVNSTRVIGQAIAVAKNSPKVWLQASTATIYAHRYDAANDEETGIIGGDEPNVPRHWKKSILIALAWEAELAKAKTPNTRKVALRSAMTMSRDKGSVFDTMATLAKRGLGGTVGDGRQYMSWIHGEDFCCALEFLIDHEELDGPVNLASPNPIPNQQFNRILRESVGAKFGPPTPKLFIEIGTRLMGTESELVLKSRRVVPKRLLDAGFRFNFPTWQEAARDLTVS